MVRFEEEVVDRWFILRGYLTARNLVYQSSAKREGGRGKGEIDLLALKMGDKIERVRCEVASSIVNEYPFNDRDIVRLVNKFFSKGAHELACKYLGSADYENLLVINRLRKNAENLFRDWLTKTNSKLVRFKPTESGAEIEIEHNPEDREIELGGLKKIKIIEFSKVREELLEMFRREKLLTRDFADPVMRAIQYMAKDRR